MKKTQYLIILLAVIALHACFSSPMASRITMGEKPGEDGRYQGVRSFDAKYEKVFEAVMEMIKYKEYKLKNKDRQKGIIESDYRSHDGLFTLGFIGGKVRSQIFARIKELKTNKTQVTLRINAEKDIGLGGWFHHPVTERNLDLIDSDNYELLFFFVTSYIKNGEITKVVY